MIEQIISYEGTQKHQQFNLYVCFLLQTVKTTIISFLIVFKY